MTRSIRQQSPAAVRVLGAGRVVEVSGPPDRRIGQLMSAQHGCVSRGQLLSAGLTTSQIRTRIDRSQLQVLHRGIYTAMGNPGPPLLREAAALLAAGPSAALGRMTAARMWKLLPAEPGQPRIETVQISGSRARSRAGIEDRRTTTLTGAQIRTIQNLPVTSPERTLLDIAKLDQVSERQLERAVDEALGLRLTSLTKLNEMIADSSRRPGAHRLKRLLDQRQGSTITKRELEARFLTLIRDAGLPDPQTQAPIAGFEVDAYWPDAQFVVELDSYRWHTLRSNFERDRRKDRVLQSIGLLVSRVTWAQIRDEALEVAAHVATTLARRTRSASEADPSRAAARRSSRLGS